MISVTQNLIAALPAAVAAGAAVPLNYPRIGYENLVRGLTPTVSSTAAGFFAGALANSLTYEFWSPSASPATATFNFSPGDVNYIALAGHSLFSTGTSVKFEISEDGGGTYTTLSEIVPANDNALMLLFPTYENASAVRLTFTYTGTAPVLAVVYVGRTLDMERGLYGGHSPITLARATEIRPMRSDSGQFIGRSITSRAFRTSAAFKNLTAEWYRDNFDPFVKEARRYPFFFAWNPEEHPEEIAFCWSNSDIVPSNMGLRDLMTVTLPLQGYGVEL